MIYGVIANQLKIVSENNRMDYNFLTPIFNEFNNIFQDTIRELFINKCLCKEASLYFFVIEIDSLKIYCANADGLIEDIKCEKNQSVKDAMSSYLAEKYGKKYWPQKICDIYDHGIFFAYSSVTVDYCRGRYFFECVCGFLTALFSELLEQIIFIGDSQERKRLVEAWRLQRHYLIQQCIQKAAGKTIQYLQKLYAPLNFAFIDQLSGQYYERSACQSTLILLFRDAVSGLEESDFAYYFDEKQFPDMTESSLELIPPNIRCIRKLLQIAQEGLCLVLGEDADRKIFQAIGICNEGCFQRQNLSFSYIKIYFRGHMQWDFWVNQTYIFSYRNGQYKIDNEVTSEALIGLLQSYFEDYEENYRDASSIIVYALEQKHGTMVTIMKQSDAEDESRRLGEKEYGLLNVHQEIGIKNIKQFSNIDGSLIMDTSGEIYGIGMILDGYAEMERGSLARGARYNSVIKYNEYLEKRNIKAMTFVISEDGTLDIQSSKIRGD